MGSTISTQGFDEGDLSTKGTRAAVDPILEKLQDLHVVRPILKSQASDTTLTDILLRRSPSQAPAALDPTTTVKLFELYQNWQRTTAAKVQKNQEELGYKIIGVEELSMKLLQRLHYASRVMETSANHLKQVESLQIEILDMKRTLTKTLQSYEKLGEQINALGLQDLNIKPMAIVNPHHQGEEDDINTSVTSPSEVHHESVADT